MKEVSQKRTHLSTFYLVFGLLFLLCGVGTIFEPMTPPFGVNKGLGVVFHATYLLVGKYGPSLLFGAMGFMCLFLWWKQRRNI